MEIKWRENSSVTFAKSLEFKRRLRKEEMMMFNLDVISYTVAAILVVVSSAVVISVMIAGIDLKGERLVNQDRQEQGYYEEEESLTPSKAKTDEHGKVIYDYKPMDKNKFKNLH